MGIPAKSVRAFRNLILSFAVAVGAVAAVFVFFFTHSFPYSFMVFPGGAVLGALAASYTFTCPRCWKSVSSFSLRPGKYCKACGSHAPVAGFRKKCVRCRTSRRYQKDLFCTYCGEIIFSEK